MDDGGPDDGGEKKGKKDQDKDKPKLGKLLTLPTGRQLDPEKDLGAPYVLGQTSGLTTAEIVDPVSISQEVRDRQNYVSNQELVKAIENRGTTSEVIDVVLKEIAEEISHIKWERRRATKEGKNTTAQTVNRISGLKSLADLLLKRKEASLAERLDLKSPRFQAVFKIWMEFFFEAMEKNHIEEHVIDLVLQQMKADMVGWEKKMDLAGVD